MGTRPGYIYLGSIKKGGDHGALLNSFKRSLMAVPSTKRKRNILKRLEISEVMCRLGLSRVLVAFHFGDEEESEEEAIQRVGMQIYQALDSKFGQRLQSLAVTPASVFPDSVAAITPAASDELVPSSCGSGVAESPVIEQDLATIVVVSQPAPKASSETSGTVTMKKNSATPKKKNEFVSRFSGLTKLHS